MLVVDDDRDVCDLIVEILEMRGYSPVGALDAGEGLRLLESGLRPRLLVVDLCMPRMDGVAFIEAARAAHPDWKPSVLFCSGSPEARSPPPDARVLLKPFELKEICAEIERAIGPGPRGKRRARG